MSKLIDTLDQIDEIMSEARELKEKLELIQRTDKPIIPCEAGELWEHRDGICGISLTFNNKVGRAWLASGDKATDVNDNLTVYDSSGMKDMIHGQNGWKRLFPPVNDGEVIVIEGVTWHYEGGYTYPSAKGELFGMMSLENKPPMTMTLTIPKEKTNG